MKSLRALLLLSFGLCLVTACDDDQGRVLNPLATQPTVVAPNVLASAFVGAPVIYDATKGGSAISDPIGSGLKYTITLAGNTNGLVAVGGTIGGTPTQPGVVNATLTGTDARGRSVTDAFSIVVFAQGLAAPPAPGTIYHYSDATSGISALFTSGPTSLASLDNTPVGNPITDAGATLGRVLFYDPRLSASDGTTCASCHIQSVGFTDRLQFSVGFAGGFTARHTPGLSDSRYYKRGHFFWDERANALEDQVLGPIQSTTEMGMTLDALVLKLSATPAYASLFTAAFGTPVITSDRISRALAQFVRSMVSSGSRYDRAFSTGGPPNFAAVFTPQEVLGEQLFRTKGCAACHTTIAQVADSIHNTGLDATITDNGAGGGAFKVPSLRDVAVRPRYMHDGRFTSLEDVIDFYDHGVQANPGLDARLKTPNGTPLRLNLTASDKAALVAFLNTLTDSTFLSDPRFSNPFVATVTTPVIPVTPVAPPTTPVTPVTIATGAVTIQGNAYHPATITVSPGAVVTWTNLDNTNHSAQFSSTAIVSTPRFSSGSRTVTMPTTPGTYAYHCIVHGFAMSGTVIVQ